MKKNVGKKELYGEGILHTREHSDQNPVAVAGIHPRKRRRQRRHLISISHPREPFLHPDRAEKSPLFSERLYAREITYIFNGHAWLFAGSGPFDFTPREMCSGEREAAEEREKHAARGKGPRRNPREGTFRDACYVP